MYPPPPGPAEDEGSEAEDVVEDMVVSEEEEEPVLKKAKVVKKKGVKKLKVDEAGSETKEEVKSKVEKLSLFRLKVTDEDVKVLVQNCKKISELDLGSTAVTEISKQSMRPVN